MRHTLFIAAILALGCFGFLAGVAQADQGSTGAAFLQLDTSPRVIGMGDSFTGLADDLSDIEYNPAGSAYLTQKELTLMDASWIQGISYDYGAVAWPFSFGTLSADFFYLNAGTFQETTLGGPGGYTEEGTFTAGSMYGTVAYGRKILPYLSVGLSLKFLNETIQEYSASDISAGLSAFYHSPIPGLTAGLSIANLGPSESFSGGSGTGGTGTSKGAASPLPANFRLGVGYKPSDDISVDSDYVQYFNTVGSLSVGGEYAYRILVFRLGYKFQGGSDYQQVEQGYGPAAAAGLDLGLGIRLFKKYSLDYAYSPQGFLGTSNVFSLTAKFD